LRPVPHAWPKFFDPANRRYRYPFTNCTNCGPRFTIIEALPYDRPNTTMRQFVMCRDCQAEYEQPLDRRFHAQPTPARSAGRNWRCGRRTAVSWATGDDALLAAAQGLREGKIVAVKGLGGFLLMTDVRRSDAIIRAARAQASPRQAICRHAGDLDQARTLCEVIRRRRRCWQRPRRRSCSCAEGGGRHCC